MKEDELSILLALEKKYFAREQTLKTLKHSGRAYKYVKRCRLDLRKVIEELRE